MDYYHELCKECEHLYHCFGIDIGEKIENEDVNDLYLHPSNCNSYYPLIKQ